MPFCSSHSVTFPQMSTGRCSTRPESSPVLFVPLPPWPHSSSQHGFYFVFIPVCAENAQGGDSCFLSSDAHVCWRDFVWSLESLMSTKDSVGVLSLSLCHCLRSWIGHSECGFLSRQSRSPLLGRQCTFNLGFMCHLPSCKYITSIFNLQVQWELGVLGDTRVYASPRCRRRQKIWITPWNPICVNKAYSSQTTVTHVSIKINSMCCMEIKIGMSGECLTFHHVFFFFFPDFATAGILWIILCFSVTLYCCTLPHSVAMPCLSLLHTEIRWLTSGTSKHGFLSRPFILIIAWPTHVNGFRSKRQWTNGWQIYVVFLQYERFLLVPGKRTHWSQLHCGWRHFVELLVFLLRKSSLKVILLFH